MVLTQEILRQCRGRNLGDMLMLGDGQHFLLAEAAHGDAVFQRNHVVSPGPRAFHSSGGGSRLPKPQIAHLALSTLHFSSISDRKGMQSSSVIMWSPRDLERFTRAVADPGSPSRKSPISLSQHFISRAF